MKKTNLSMSLVALAVCFLSSSENVTILVDALSLSANAAVKGTAATPGSKRKIAVLGGGGYMGAMTFGFLQRASAIWGTGMGACRCIGATADTSIRLNRVLSQHFCLAVADESVVKLTDLESVQAIQDRLSGWDALILGGAVRVKKLPVTANTFGKTPNDKTWDIYWEEKENDVDVDKQLEILSNVLQAAKSAGVQHVVAVIDSAEDILFPLIRECGVPYTCIQPIGEMGYVKDYTYRKGVQGWLSVAPAEYELIPKSTSLISREDIAALCVEVLQTLDWKTSRHLRVSCWGAVGLDDTIKPPAVQKRPDQEWCVNSFVLRDKLMEIN